MLNANEREMIIYTILIFGTLITLYSQYGGFIVSILALMVMPQIYNKYKSVTTLMKFLLVIIFSIILFYKLSFKSSIDFNVILRLLLAINVLCLALTTFKNPFVKRYF